MQRQLGPRTQVLLVLLVVLAVVGVFALAYPAHVPAHVPARAPAAADGFIDATSEYAIDAGSVNSGILGVQYGGTGNTVGKVATVNASSIKSGILAEKYGGTGSTTGGRNLATYCRVTATSLANGVSNSGGKNVLQDCTVAVETSDDILQTRRGWNASTRVFDIPFSGVWHFSWQGRYAIDDNAVILNAAFRVTGDVSGGVSGSTLGASRGHWSPQTAGAQRDGTLTFTAIIKDPMSSAASVYPEATSHGQGQYNIYAGQVFTAMYMGTA
jgi:hypothetical protein